MLRFLVSMSGPGTRPWIRKAPSRMAMVALPGTPKATVGTSAPPSLALLELSEAITPRTSPLPNVGLGPFPCFKGGPEGEPVHHRGADAGNRADAAADPGAAHDQPPVVQTILHALPLAFVDVGSARVRRNGDACDEEIAELRQREDAEEERGERQAVPQIKAVERPPQRAGLRGGPDHRDHSPEAPRDNAAQRRIAREHGHHGDAEHGEGEQFRRAD